MTQSSKLSAVPKTPAGGRLGPVLAFLVAVLAFLLASFPVRNSDVWLHLARGRMLAQGGFPSADPDLAFESWGNQTWLYDLCCYSCYRVLGGPGLAVGKALLAAGIALLLVRLSRSVRAGSVSDGNQPVVYAFGSFSGWCVPALCTSLALLTMSLYLLFQPTIISYLFLALLLTFLRAGSVLLLPWPLLLLFVVWANVDRWFLLGLGVVVLVWLGEIMDTAFADSARRWPAALFRRGFSLLVLAAVCLLNPSHLRAFVLADELTRSGSSTGQAMSPFTGAFWAKVGWNPASISYYLLLGLSLVSFVAALPRWRWQRFLPWLGLALLSAAQARAIPFFAIVAGPVLAWNIRDILARLRSRAGSVSDGKDPSLTLPARAGAVLTGMVVLLLVVCAWPGWLQVPPFGPRSWALDLSPSLERGAAAVRRWHEDGKLAADSGGLHLSAESIYAFAWFCPTEKRLRVTAQGSTAELRQRMRSDGIRYFLVYDTDRERLSAVLSGLVEDAEQWPLLYLEGDVAIFGWRDPDQAKSAGLFRGWQLDLDRLAFHPSKDKKAPPEATDPRAARYGWDAFWKAAPPRSIDRNEALMHLLHAEALQRVAPLRHLRGWENSQAAGLIGAATTWTSPVALCDAHLRLALFRPHVPEDGSRAERPSPLDRLTFGLQRLYTLPQDDAPPALYYLAVRAARRAVAANPDDARAYLLLGEGYLGLLHATRERAWGRHLQQLVQLRQVQASAALNRAVALRPDLLQAHLHLARLYQGMGYLDRALEHLRTFCSLARKASPPSGLSEKDYRARQAQNEEEVERLARQVQRQEDSFTVAAADRPPRERAFMALQKGLGGKALQLLLESDRSAFGNEGVELELELLLGVGRARDVLEWLSPGDESALGPLTYHWLRVRASAALGDYTRAEEETDESARAVALGPNSSEPVRLRENMAMTVAKLVLDELLSKEASLANLLVQINQAEYGPFLQMMAQRLRQQADLTVVHGLLALEEGEVEEAKFAFTSALALWKDNSTTAAGGGMDFNGRIIAQSCLRWLE